MSAGGGQVNLWVARLDQDPSVLDRLFAGLTVDEQQRATAIPSAVQRRRVVATHGILRLLLAGQMDCHPRDVRIVRPHGGKPALLLDEPIALRFNLSHSDDLVVFALTDGVEVGVDIERLRQLWNVRGLAASVLSTREHAAFQVSDDLEHALLVRWTLKESVLKGLGDGLTRAPASIEVDVPRGNEVQPVRIDGRASAWWARCFIPADGYVGAVALDRSDFSLRVHTWSPAG